MNTFPSLKSIIEVYSLPMSDGQFEGVEHRMAKALKTTIEALKSISDFKSYEGALRPDIIQCEIAQEALKSIGYLKE